MEFPESVARFFDLFFGLPLHPLVVHGVVVLVPLFALYVAVRAVKNQLIQRNVILLGFVLVLIAISTRLSGEALASRIGYDAIEKTGHLNAGNMYPLIVFGFLILVIIYNKSLQRRRYSRWWFAPLVKGLLVIASAGLLLFTLWTGHTGATSHWQGIRDYTEYGDQKP